MGKERSSRSPDRRDRRSHSRSRSRERSESLEKNMIREGWRIVKSNPSDFEGWTRLLKLVEKVDDLKYARDAYDSFLKRYPYCYGYWKKYAELEKQHKHYEKCLNVYERGLEAIPLSIDLWLSYIIYVREIAQGQRQATAKIRDVYMRALEACGLEFRSDKLWEEYIEWEILNEEIEKAAVLFDVMIITPTADYASHFEKYKIFVNRYEPDKILSPDEYDEITDVVYNRVKEQLDGKPMYFMEEYEEENIPNEGENYEQRPKKLVSRRKHLDIVLVEFREEIINRRKKRHLDNEKEVAARWEFENAIKRPYFHVKPLEREQIKNWYDYLNFEIKQKKKSRILFLFERCMIACALYDEMWIKYATYLDYIGDESGARSVFKRASDVHVSRKPGIHLAFSLFEEKHGNIEEAQTILQDFNHRHPNYSSISLRLIAIERRRLVKEGESEYPTIVAKYERLINDPATTRKVGSFYALKLARFYFKICHNRKMARKVIKKAIERDPNNVQLYLQLIDLAFNATHLRDSEIVSAMDFAIECADLSLEDRFQFSIRKLEYLEELGSDVLALQEHISQHLAMEKALLNPAMTIFSGKRGGTSTLNKDSSGESEEKKPKIEPPQATIQPVVNVVGYNPAQLPPQQQATFIKGFDPTQQPPPPNFLVPHCVNQTANLLATTGGGGGIGNGSHNSIGIIQQQQQQQPIVNDPKAMSNNIIPSQITTITTTPTTTIPSSACIINGHPMMVVGIPPSSKF